MRAPCPAALLGSWCKAGTAWSVYYTDSPPAQILIFPHSYLYPIFALKDKAWIVNDSLAFNWILGILAGEFTLRAFLNCRLDLAQAESVVQLVAAKTSAAAQSALAGIQVGTLWSLNAEMQINVCLACCFFILGTRFASLRTSLQENSKFSSLSAESTS